MTNYYILDKNVQSYTINNRAKLLYTQIRTYVRTYGTGMKFNCLFMKKLH